MKVDYVEESSCRRRLDVEVPADRVTEAFEDKASRLSRSLKLPGFRKGKIPRELVKTRYKAELLNEVVQDILPHALGTALHERSLNPLGDPQISDLQVGLGEPLRFRATFEVMPRVEVRDYQGLEVSEPKVEVSEAEIDERLEALRERAATFVAPQDRGARDGDLVRGTIYEKESEGKGAEKKQEGVLIELGSDVYHPALHEKLQNANPGDEISFRVSFPADHPDTDRAGKSFDVRFDVQDVKEKVLPKLDDELAKDVGEFDRLDELRAHLRNQAEELARARAQQEIRHQLLEKLVAANAFEPPETLVEHELDRRIEELARNLIDRGVDPRRAQVDWQALRAGQRESAVRSVQATILLDRIAEQEGLRETEEEVQHEIERLASELERSVEAVRAQLAKEGGLELLKRRLRREKAVDLLRQNARIRGG